MASVTQYSSYYYALDENARKRYKENLQKLGEATNPYLKWQTGTTIEWQLWPEVEYPNIYNFLIATPSLFTSDSLKAYKSLDAYNYYISGWIDNIHVTNVPCCPGTHLISARVKHSQKLSTTPVKP